MGLRDVAGSGDVREGRPLPIRLGTRELALFRVEGRVYAISNLCPHQYQELHEGTLCDGVVTCPLHGWRFDVRTGRPPGPAAFPRVDSYEVVEEGGRILVADEPRPRTV